MSEIAIRGGTVVDGTGSPGFEADVLVRDGRVAEIGSGLTAERTLDASGCVVAPGFIDIHTHYDAQVFWDPALTPSCFHGVTTATLAAGIPWEFETFPEYLDSVEKRGTVLNYAAYIGHTALRLFHMGDDAYEREATAGEVSAMAQTVREAMEAGAAGLATSFAPTHVGMGGKPVCSRLGGPEEFEPLAMELSKLGRGVIEATLGAGFAFDEIYDFQRRIGVPVTYTALLATPGLWQHGSKVHAAEREKGTGVWPQVSCRAITLQVQMKSPFPFDQAAPFSELYAEAPEVRWQRYRDPAWRARALEALGSTALPTRFEKFEVAESEVHADLIDRNVAELAKERGCSPLDLMLDLSLEEQLETRFRYIQANDDLEGVEHLLQQEQMAIGLSDAGAHVGMLCDAPLPTDLLGRWVREKGVLGLEQAVHKLTGEPASIFRFEDRGVVREGAHADLCVFDPARVGPAPLRRVRDFPADADRLTADAPEGVVHVLVNGVPIQTDGESHATEIEERPGVRPAQTSFR